VDACLTIPRLLALTEHWRQFPPIAEAFAAFAGIDAPPRAPATGASDEGGDFGQFLSAFGALGGVVPATERPREVTS